MKRIAWMLLFGLLVCPRGVAAYDGPGAPLTYDHLINGIRVVMTSQPTVLNGGRARFTLTAHVPVEPDTVGRNIRIEIRRYAPELVAGYATLGSCLIPAQAGQVNQTAEFSCWVSPPDAFLLIGSGLSESVGFYPYVERPSDTPASYLVHDGVAQRLQPTVSGQDSFEPNNTLVSATNLGSPTSPFVLNNVVSFEPDYYRFQVPAGAGSVEVRAEFWNAASDVDLTLLDFGGTPVTLDANSSLDVEQVNYNVSPGETYYLLLDQVDTSPGFYNLTITFSTPDVVSITAGPSGVPNPVSAGGIANLTVTAVDSLGHALNYAWSQVCSGQLSGLGTFGDRFAQTTTWVAPGNPTPSAKACFIRVTVDDGLGNSTVSQYTQTVGPDGDVISVTSGAAGTPNPITPPGPVSLSVAATDSFGHVLSYHWTANCPGLGTNGTFSPNANVQNPTWNAPVNATGSQLQCVLTASISDGQGVTQSTSYLQTLNATPHTLTITQQPGGAPNPLASASTAFLTVVASDTLSHALTYGWTATCAAPLGGNGSFTNVTTASPTWTAPANLTGIPQDCSIQVTVNDGAGGLSQSASYVHTVSSVAHQLTITQQPGGSPNPAASGATVAVSVAASDTLPHTLAYAWSASCPALSGNGSFIDGDRASASWTAPSNLTGSSQTCTIQATVSDGAGGLSQSASYSQTVNSVPHSLTITLQPSGTPNPVASAGAVAVSVAASDSLLHVLTYSWSATCTGSIGTGTFSAGSTATPTWTAPSNLTGSTQTCTVQVVISDGAGGLSQTASYAQSVDSVPHSLTITQAPQGAPNPVASGGSVAVSVTASDSLLHPLTYAWSATCAGSSANGLFTNGTTATPTWQAPANLSGGDQVCSLRVVVDDGAGGLSQTAAFDQVVQSVPHTLTLTQAPQGSPNPVGSAGAVTASVIAVDSLNRALTYAWTASCVAALGGAGTLTDASTATPTWTAPANLTGASQTCSLQVIVTEPIDGLSQTASYTQSVNSIPHTITITQPPAGTPNPAASAGSVAVSVTAIDSLGRPLNFVWGATCSSPLGSNGSFTSGNTAAATWTAPSNLSGATQTCTLHVVVSEPTEGLSETASYAQMVESIPHTVTITQAPAGTPNPVASAGTVSASVVANDSLGRALTYAWASTCPSLGGVGSFTDGSSASPTWTAPINLTGATASCTLQVTVSEPIDGLTQTASYAQSVESAPHTLTITDGPAGIPNPATSGGVVTVNVTAVDSLNRTLTYAWSASCASELGAHGTFENPATQTSQWTAPINLTGTTQSCTLQVVVTEPTDGLSQTASYVQEVGSVSHTITITGQPAGSPNPVASGGAAALTVAAVDSLNRTLTYVWTASCAAPLGSHGVFTNASTATPTWTAPANLTGATQSCTMQVVVTEPVDGLSQSATYQQSVLSIDHTLTITQAPTGFPNPVDSGGQVSVSVAAADSLNRTLTFAWTATCAAPLGGSGVFASASSATTTWTAPLNTTGSDQTCTLQMTVTEPIDNVTQTASYVQAVRSVPHTLTITQQPGGTPNPTASGGTVAASVTAADSLDRALTYAWTSTCAEALGSHGVFTDTSAATPQWTAPSNLTGIAQACTLQVTVSEPIAGLTQTASYTQAVESVPHTLTITEQPSGAPNPVASGGNVSVTAAAADSLGHAVNYAWTAACAPGLSANGTFGSPTAASSTWTAPVNLTGTGQSCTLTVSIDDGSGGQTASASYVQAVESVAHTVTFSLLPSGTPNPVDSGGSAALGALAVDSLQRPLTYAWSVTCDVALGGNGTLSGAGTVAPTWTAPSNLSGAPRTCTVQVVATEPIDNLSQSASYLHTVAVAPHSLQITQLPAGAPNPVASGGAVALAVTASDSLGRTVSYAWSASCGSPLPGPGAFSDAGVQNPTWTAPINQTGAAQTCSIQVTVTEPIDGISESASFVQTVDSVPHTLTVTTNASGTPNPVISAATVAIAFAAADSLNHTLTYAWQSACPGLPTSGTFLPNAGAAQPSWKAPVNATGSAQACTLTVNVTDGTGANTTSSFTQTVNAATHTLTMTSAPNGAPNPSVAGQAVPLSVGVLDTFDHTLSYLWQSTCSGNTGNGSFSPNASASSPSWTPPANLGGSSLDCLIRVTVIDNVDKSVNGSFIQRVVNQAPPHTVTFSQQATGTPNPVASAGAVSVSSLAVDSLGHTLSYAWTASCPALSSSGSYANAASAATTWTAPANSTGTAQTCSLQVTASDGQGQTASSNFTQSVSPVLPSITITAGPSGTPNPVASGGTVITTLSATHSLGLSLTYQWTASCPGSTGSGTFLPAANVATPAWSAPTNSGTTELTCTLQVVVSDGQTQTVTRSFTERVSGTAPPHTLTITAGPTGTPNPVVSAQTVSVSVTAVDSASHSLTYQWTASCPTASSNGAFSNAAAQNPTWTAPAITPGSTAACTIAVAVSDGQGLNTSQSYVHNVTAPTTHTLSITQQPNGSPNPSGPGAPVALSVTAVDTFGHTLSYLWQASCAEVSGTGTFSPSATHATPTWTPPNNNGGDLNCLIRVSIIDTQGLSAQGAFIQKVTAAGPAHTITMTGAPSGTPNPVASAGTANLTATAVDSLGHTVSYQWSASCPALGATGTFSNASAQAPTWTAPTNVTGAAQSCTVSVVASDGLGQSANASYSHSVSPSAHQVTFTTAASGSPNPVGSAGVVALSAAAVDSQGHSLSYQWSATCGGGLGSGAFSPSANVATPSWTAPANAGASEVTCALQVTASDGQGVSADSSYNQRISGTAPPHSVTITAGPSGTPNPVTPGNTAAVSATAVDSASHALTYAWSASCSSLASNGTFTPSNSGATTNWLAPTNATGTTAACTLSVTASDSFGQSATASFTQNVSPGTPLHTLTITQAPSASPSPSAPGQSVALTVVAVDTFTHPFPISYLWQSTCSETSSGGTFSPSATSRTPTWTPPAGPGGNNMCLVRVTVNDNVDKSASASFIHQVTPALLPESVPHTLSITAGPGGTPNPVPPGGNVSLSAVVADSLEHSLDYVWQATCSSPASDNGRFTPSAQSPAPVWQAPVADTGFSCELRLTVTDADNKSVWNTYTQQVSDEVLTTEGGISEGRTSDSASFVDADRDGMDDRWESRHGLNATDVTDGAADSDNDGLDNEGEYDARTNPWMADTDGDGVADGVEVRHGYAPNDPGDWTPPVLRTSVGHGAVYLNWIGAVPSGAALKLRVESLDERGDYVSVGDVALEPSVFAHRITALPDGQPLRNGHAYRLALLLVRDDVTRTPLDDDRRRVTPNGWTARTARRPVLFLSAGDSGTANASFDHTLHFATATLGWQPGVTLFTLDASHQLGAALGALAGDGQGAAVVALDSGADAVRAYLADSSNVDGRLSSLVAYESSACRVASQETPPQNVTYAAILGGSSDCVPAAWSRILKTELNGGEGSDLANILCALDDRCLVVRTRSDVTLELVGPGGQRLSRQVSEIPGARFSEPVEGGIAETTLTLPLVEPGRYELHVTVPSGAPKAYSIDIIREGQSSTTTRQATSSSTTIDIPVQ